MKAKVSFWIVLALASGCHSPGPVPHAAGGVHSAEALTGLAGNPEIERHLEISGASLERVAGGVVAAFVLRNRDSCNVELEFLVQGYARSGRALPDARTAWTLLSLGPREERSIRSAALPTETESWRLITRMPGSR